jgi:hypothetical protein
LGWWNTQNLPTPAGVPINFVWERGHLIGSKLGGAGGWDFRNMVALRAPANKQMYFGTEVLAERAALAGKCIDYLAVPEFDGTNWWPAKVYVLAVADGEQLFPMRTIFSE